MDLPDGLPATIKVGYKDWTIVSWPVVEAMDANRYGETAHQASVLRIDFSHGYRKSAHTLLHEIMHATSAMFMNGKADEEEHWVSGLSNGLASVWRDNPEVLAWIGTHLTA